MSFERARFEERREELVAELTDVALHVAFGDGVRGPSVEVEVDLWRALDGAVRRPGAARERARPGDLSAGWADAAYRVALGHGLSRPFHELELDLWKAVRRVARQPRFAGLVDCLGSRAVAC
jgi:hypothetical protein